MSLFVLTFLWMAVLSGVRAEDESEAPVKVIMPLWGPTIQADGSGLFVDLFHFVMDDWQGEYAVDFVSYDEVLQQLLYSDSECAYPLNKPSVLVSYKHTDPGGLVESRPVLVSKTYLFSRQGDPVIKSREDMNGKLLIQIRGENYNHNFKTSQARFWNVDTEIDKVTVLLSGRGDAMLGSLPDIYFSFRDLDVDIPPYDPDFAVLDYRNAMVCRTSGKTQAMINHFNARVNQLVADGGLRARAISQGVPELIVDAFLPVYPLQ